MINLMSCFGGRMKKVSLDEVLNKPLIPVMWKLGWPVMVSSILESVYHLVDTFWLGHYQLEKVEMLSQVFNLLFQVCGFYFLLLLVLQWQV